MRTRSAALIAMCSALTLLSGMPTPAQRATDDPVRRVRRPITGQYLVRLQPGEDAHAVAAEATARFKGQLRHVYHRAVSGFSARLTDAAARAMARDPRVAVVEEDGVVTPVVVQWNPPSWGLDRIDQRTLPLDDRYTYPAAAATVHVYVVDSGIRTSHVEFEGRAAIAADFVDDDGDGDPDDVGNDDADPGSPDGADCLGHGTHMAATIAGATTGVARTPLLWSVRVIGCDGVGSWSTVVAAIEEITANAPRPAVVNISLSGPPSDVADEAIRRSIASGITYVVAAGNGGEDAASHSPSRVLEALVVGSAAADDRRSVFSNWGLSVDLFAPGEAIPSATADSDVDLLSASGTSSAAAHASGVAALYSSLHPAAAPLEVMAAITGAATRGVVGDPGPGAGRLLFSGFLLNPPVVTVTVPNTAVDWGLGSHQIIAWTHNLPAKTGMRVLISRDGGKSYTAIADRAKDIDATTGQLIWQVTGPPTAAAVVRVESADGRAADRSDSPFAISPAYLRIRTPGRSDRWTAGQNVGVRWAGNLGPADFVTIALSKNDGQHYRWILVPTTGNDGAETLRVHQAWTTPRGRLQVSWQANPEVAGRSEAFAIGPH